MNISIRAQKLAPSPTFAIDAKVKIMQRQGIDVINFGIGEPDFDTPDCIKKAAIKAITDGYTKYTPVSGTEELKKAICTKFAQENKVQYLPSEIAVSPGAKFSLYAVIQALVNPGDEVIIPTPFWVTYSEQVKLAGGKPVFIPPIRNFQLNIPLIKKSITANTKCIIVNSPNNPSGAVFPKKDLKNLFNIAKQHDLFIISDEIYEKFNYSGEKHCCLGTFGKENVIIVNGVSKTYAMTGWRIGYIAAPEKIVAAVSAIQSQSTSNPTSISQKATTTALLECKEYKKMVKEFCKRRNYIYKRLCKINGIHCNKPTGAFYIFPDISAFGTSIDVANKLMDEAHVAVVPGKDFGDDRCIRLSYAIPMTSIREGLDRMERFFLRG